MYRSRTRRVKAPFKVIHFAMLIGILMAKLTAFEEFSSLGITAFSGTSGFDPAIHFASTFMLYTIIGYIVLKTFMVFSKSIIKWLFKKYVLLMHENIYSFIFAHFYVVFVLFLACVGAF